MAHVPGFGFSGWCCAQPLLCTLWCRLLITHCILVWWLQVRVLVEEGKARLDVTNRYGDTPLDEAREAQVGARGQVGCEVIGVRFRGETCMCWLERARCVWM